ncbi:MAG: hypothetical protein AAF614_22795 [Chloroflexota bacterium]
MGQRAEYVIIKDANAIVYYEKWGGLSAVLVFSEGPKEAVNFAPFIETTEALDAVFAEGGYLIDFDLKVAIVFGDPPHYDEDDKQTVLIDEALGESPLAFLQLIAPRWRGWKLIWDYRGVSAFADHLLERNITNIGLLTSSYTSEYEPEPPVVWQT